MLRSIAALSLAIVALVAFVNLTGHESDGNSVQIDGATVLFGSSASDSKVRALQRIQVLHSRISAPTEDKQHATVPELRSELLNLKSTLKSELKNVDSLLSGLGGTRDYGYQGGKVVDGDKGQARQNVEEQVIDKDHAKRIMQQGALRGDTVEKQLRKVLDDDLEKLITHDTKWKSKKDLDNAVKFASYLKDHPLNSDSDQSSGKSALRGHQVALDSQLASVPQSDKTGADGGGLVQAVDTVPEYFRNSGAVPNGDEGAEFAQVGCTHSVPHHGCTDSDRAQPVRDAPPPRLQYSNMPRDREMELASAKGRQWAHREALREHGEFVRLPSGGGFPRPVRGYWG